MCPSTRFYPILPDPTRFYIFFAYSFFFRQGLTRKKVKKYYN